jgi:hypothetical protein
LSVYGHGAVVPFDALTIPQKASPAPALPQPAAVELCNSLRFPLTVLSHT